MARWRRSAAWRPCPPTSARCSSARSWPGAARPSPCSAASASPGPTAPGTSGSSTAAGAGVAGGGAGLPLDRLRRARAGRSWPGALPALGAGLRWRARCSPWPTSSRRACVGSEGELPFAAPHGRGATYVDLVGAGGGFAGLEDSADGQRFYPRPLRAVRRFRLRATCAGSTAGAAPGPAADRPATRVRLMPPPPPPGSRGCCPARIAAAASPSRRSASRSAPSAAPAAPRSTSPTRTCG